MNRRKVIRSYRAAFDNPVHLKTGEEVEVGKADDEYPGWVWCTAPGGNQGWVPGIYLDFAGTHGWLRCDYDATELTVEQGTIVDEIKEVSGWAWCRAANDTYGWIPKNRLDG